MSVAQKINEKSVGIIKFIAYGTATLTTGAVIDNMTNTPVVIGAMAATLLAFKKKNKDPEAKTNPLKKFAMTSMALALPIPLALAAFTIPPVVRRIRNNKEVEQENTTTPEEDTGKELADILAKVAVMTPDAQKTLLKELTTKKQTKDNQPPPLPSMS